MRYVEVCLWEVWISEKCVGEKFVEVRRLWVRLCQNPVGQKFASWLPSSVPFHIRSGFRYILFRSVQVFFNKIFLQRAWSQWEGYGKCMQELLWSQRSVWFNCAALRGLRIPATFFFVSCGMGWLGRLEVIVVCGAAIVDALFHVAGMGRERQFCMASAAQTCDPCPLCVLQ